VDGTTAQVNNGVMGTIQWDWFRERVDDVRALTGTVLFVADYSPDQVEVDLSEKVAAPSAVMDLDSGTQLASLKPGAGAVRGPEGAVGKGGGEEVRTLSVS
jgi:hypothetical protein